MKKYLKIYQDSPVYKSIKILTNSSIQITKTFCALFNEKKPSLNPYQLKFKNNNLGFKTDLKKLRTIILR